MTAGDFAVTDKRILSMAAAIREGLEEASVADPSVIFFAEGVDDPSAVYGTLKDIGKRIGKARMIEMPVAENGLCGIAVGAALMGKRPVISFHRVEFVLLAIEQIVNHAAKAHYLSQGRHRVPLLIRLIIGRGWGQGPEHSQSLETLFASFPGLKVIMPAYPGDAKGMIAAAVSDDNPVICIESRWSHYSQGPVPEGLYTSPLDGPRVVRNGSDITIVASSYMTLEAVRAADKLAQQGVSAEVVDLRVLRPFKPTAIIDSVRKTGRLLTVDNGFRTLGMGAEIVAEATQQAFPSLKAAPVRLGMPDHPVPSSRGFLPGLYPDAARIVSEAGRIVGLDAARIDLCLGSLLNENKTIPIDVPDKYFAGPF